MNYGMMRRWMGMGVPLLMAGCQGNIGLGDGEIVATSSQQNPVPNIGSLPALDSHSVVQPLIPEAALSVLRLGSEMHSELCEDDGQHPNFPDDADAITRAFCQDLKRGGSIPTPNGLKALLRLLGLAFSDPRGGNGTGGNPAFTLTGHSSSLVSRFVSSINPRAIVFTPPPNDGSKPKGYTVLAFTRGEQFVEVAAHDPTLDQLNLYLVRFEQVCNDQLSGCSLADLLTPSLEVGWRNVRQYESSTAINNTVADCLQCHTTTADGPSILRMQEMNAPFTHFFSAGTAGGRALLTDFHAAHGTDEDYGPIPAALIDKSDPAKLSALVKAAGFGDQPAAFDSARIEAEVADSSSGQPELNVPVGHSPTWDALRARADQGEIIAVPYHDVKVTDSSKLAQMTEAYRKVRSGESPRDTLPDIRAVFLEEGFRDMGFVPAEGASGKEILIQICHQCHNSRLDQTLTRARFNVDTLDTLAPNEKRLAIERLLLPYDAPLKMPPPLFRSLTAEEQARVEQALAP